MKVVVLTNDAREIRREYGKPEPYFGTAPAALLEGFALLPGVEVHVVACWQKPMPAPQKLADNIWFHGLLVPKIGWLRTGYQGCIRAVRRKLRELQPDIVHGQGTERDCSISAIHSGFPNVLTIHGNMRVIARLNRVRPFSYYWFQARLESFTLPRSRGVICITRYTQEVVKDLAARTWILPNAVEGSFFNVRPNRASIPTILSIGVVSPRKNQVEFINSLDTLARQRAFKLRFIGDVPPDAYSAEFLAAVRARDWCEHQGFTGREELKRELASASIVALPSLEDNCPMVVLEAAAASVPVVAARVGGVPELVEDGITGLFCDPTSPASMRSQVERLLADPDLGARLASQAREAAERRFHPRVIASRHVEIYEEVLATRS
jgi:glycosyltransferase involved in cell wall biosynthesis